MNLFNWLNKKRRWSRETFGPGYRTESVIAHIRKELVEVEANPDDLFEWIDVAMLALDGASRRGFTPYEICQALEQKLEIVMARKYPPIVEGEPCEHLREDA
jgi:hypothetical protein